MANGDVEIGYIGLGSMGLGAPPTLVDFTSTHAFSKQVAFRRTRGILVIVLQAWPQICTKTYEKGVRACTYTTGLSPKQKA